MRLSLFIHSYRSFLILLQFGLLFNPLAAQNYTEVNVFGWGLATNEASPTFADIDHDGYMDMLVGETSGKIWHFEQTTGDEFALITHEFSNIDVGSEAMPVLTNLDNDSLIDLIIGSNDELFWYEQESVGSYQFSFIVDNLLLEDIGAHLAPALADINNDGLVDMLVGESLGTLTHFIQDSVNGGTFTKAADHWMGWNGGVYVHPAFTDLEGDGKLDLLIGNSNGIIHHLVQDALYSDTFTPVTANFAGIDVGQSARPQIIDIDNDHKMDLFVGEWYKGLFHYEQIDSGSSEYVLINDQVLGVRDFGATGGYTIEDIDGDGLLDMLVVEHYGGSNEYLVHYEQDEAGSLLFILINEQFNNIETGSNRRLTLFDINGNGLLDLFISTAAFGQTARYEQESVNSYTFILREEHFNAPMQVNQNPQLTFADMDGDSLLDMLVGQGQGLIHHYEQDSINANTFTEITDRFLNLDVGWLSSPVFTDIDGDNLLDLIIGGLDGKLRYYEQEEIHSENFVEISGDFASASVNLDATPRFADVNLDGRTDLFISDRSGGILLFLRGEDDDIYPPAPPENLEVNVSGEVAELTWTHSTSGDLMLYNIYRSTRNDTLVSEYINSVSANFAFYSDSSLVESGRYFYWLTALDSVGNESAFSNCDSVDIFISSLNDRSDMTVKNFTLHQNYPNPFNPSTIIKFQIPKAEFTTLKVYNLPGKEIATLVSNRLNPGNYTYTFDGKNLASGIYYYQLMAGDYNEVKKMILLK